jgi:hypothetical protein
VGRGRARSAARTSRLQVSRIVGLAPRRRTVDRTSMRSVWGSPIGSAWTQLDPHMGDAASRSRVLRVGLARRSRVAGDGRRGRVAACGE